MHYAFFSFHPLPFPLLGDAAAASDLPSGTSCLLTWLGAVLGIWDDITQRAGDPHSSNCSVNNRGLANILYVVPDSLMLT